MISEKRIRKLHKVLLSLTFLQLLIWGISGLYMVVMDIEFIRGAPFKAPPTPLNAAKVTVPPQALQHVNDADSIRLTMLAGTPVYSIEDGETTYVYSAESGDLIDHIDKTLATKIAMQGYQYSAMPPAIKSIELFSEAAPADFSSQLLPAWQVQFDDGFNTRFYIDAKTGELLRVRHQYWRFFDFMWQLHIMDYDDGADVDNPLLSVFIVSTLFSLLSGASLLVIHIRRQSIKRNRQAHTLANASQDTNQDTHSTNQDTHSKASDYQDTHSKAPVYSDTHDNVNQDTHSKAPSYSDTHSKASDHQDTHSKAPVYSDTHDKVGIITAMQKSVKGYLTRLTIQLRRNRLRHAPKNIGKRKPMVTRQVRNWHRKLAFFCIIPLILWLISAAYFNFIESYLEYEYVKQVTEQKSQNSMAEKGSIDIAKLNDVIEHQGPIREIEFVANAKIGSFSQHLLLTSDSKSWLVDKNTLQPVGVDEQLALTIVMARFMLRTEQLTTRLVINGGDDLPGVTQSFWKVDVDDDVHTSFYVDSSTGELYGPYNRYTRLKSLFLRIHFNDYAGEIGFNHWWNILLALMYILLSIFGTYYLFTFVRNNLSLKSSNRGNRESIQSADL